MIKIKTLDSQFPNTLKANFAALDTGTNEITIDFPEIETDLVATSDVQSAFAEEIKQMWDSGRTLTLISAIDVEVDGGDNYTPMYFSIPITFILAGAIYGVCTIKQGTNVTPITVELEIKRINNGDGTYTFYPEATFVPSGNQ